MRRRLNHEGARSFSDAFAEHFARGTRHHAWSVAKFAAAIDEAQRARGDRGSGPDVKTVRNWLTKGAIPQESFINEITDVSFGDDVSLADQMAQLVALWERSRGYLTETEVP